MRFRGLVHRAHNPQWSWTPLSGEGARRLGGRFNRRGIAALYTSLAQLTAVHEAQPLGRPMRPLALCTYEVDAEPVFDALDEEQCRTMGVRESDIACPTWEADMLAGTGPASQALADYLIAAGYVGMQVRSFAAGADAADINLVMWKWGPDRPARVVPIDDEGRLFESPPHRESLRSPESGTANQRGNRPGPEDDSRRDRRAISSAP